MRRLLLVLSTALLVAASTATAALATPADDARAAAERFFTALVAEDPTGVCSMLTTRVVALTGGPEKCVKLFSEDADSTTVGIGSSEPEDEEDVRDFLAQDGLGLAFRDARALGLARGGYTTKTARLDRLVRELRTLEPSFGFSIGSGPRSARGIAPRHVIVDRRTSSRRLVLFAESDSGVIFRLTAHGFQSAKVDKAGKGIPAKPMPAPPSPTPPQPDEPPPTFTVTNVSLLDDVSAYVTVAVTYEGVTVPLVLSMKLEAGAWKVDDLLLPLFGLLGAAGPGK